VVHRWNHHAYDSREIYVQGQHIGTVELDKSVTYPEESYRHGDFRDELRIYSLKGGKVYADLLDQSPSDVPSSPSVYTVMQGDSDLKAISRKVFGDTRYWYLIADANGLGLDSELKAGMVLTIPNVSAQNYNGAESFKPYNESDVMGDVTPTPPPPPKKSCNPVAMVIMVVVAVIATIYTAGVAAQGFASSASWAFSGAMSAGASVFAGGYSLGVTVGAAALGGAVGSTASQLAGMGMGVVDKFSWNQVAVGAATSAATAGMGWLGSADNAIVGISSQPRPKSMSTGAL